MVEPKRILDQLAGNREVLLQFFFFFSRFEYSLKRTGFLKPGNKAKPDWGKYADSIRGCFATVQDQKFKDAVAFLFNEPPKTQTVSGKNLGWINTRRRNGEHDETYVLRLVGTVRNNLFHGGKYPIPLGPMEDMARNGRLLEAGMIVLSQCLKLSEGVQSAFEETPY